MRNIALYITLAAGILLCPSCTKIERLIAVRTISANEVSFQVQGEVIDVGEGTVNYGFCWSTKSSPTLSDSYIKVGSTSTTKTFGTVLSGLQMGNRYYVRAYVQNSEGTSYGEALQIDVTIPYQEYAYDDGEADYGWRYNPSYQGWMGNYFPISSSGTIVSIECYFKYAEGHGNDVLNIDVFNSNQALIGSTFEFLPPTDGWITVDGDGISYSGALYVMVHWYYTMDPTNYLGMDQNGPDAGMDLGYFRDGNLTWGKTSSLTSGNQQPGVFLMRLQVQLMSGKIVTYTSGMDPSVPQTTIAEPAGTNAYEPKTLQR